MGGRSNVEVAGKKEKLMVGIGRFSEDIQSMIPCFSLCSFNRDLMSNFHYIFCTVLRSILFVDPWTKCLILIIV